MKTQLWLVFLFLISCFGCAQNKPETNIQTRQQLEASVDSLLNAYITESTPGAAVMIAYQGQPILQKGYGLRNLETKQRITPTTNMRMASVSKQFTALCILTLIDKGLMDLGDPVTDYLPYPIFEGISIQQLMKHTSGLPDYYGHFDKNWPRNKIVENADVLEWLKTNPSRDFKPGTKFEYSNTAYLMLAVIVAKVSGLDFAQYAKTQLFERLGMDKTQYYNLANPVSISERALCYGKENNTFQPVDGFFMNGVMGDGAVYTNLQDYQRYDQILRNDSILSEKIYELIWKSGEIEVGNSERPVYYASGWFVDENKEDSSHSGGWFGTSTYVYRGLKNGLTIVVFCNATELLSPGEITKELRRMSESYLLAQ